MKKLIPAVAAALLFQVGADAQNWQLVCFHEVFDLGFGLGVEIAVQPALSCFFVVFHIECFKQTKLKIIPYFCNMDFASFILAHDGDDLGALALSRSRFASLVSDFDLALTTLEVRRKLRLKVPEWYAVPSLQFPLRLSGEQCSSSETARYKASLVHGRVADLTGGLGVDSWAFAQVATEVLYNEMRPALAAAASVNFEALGLKNVRVRNCELVPSCPAPTGHLLNEVLDGFEPDFIFLDPARRASDGRKVFRLEDCFPSP